MFEALGRFVYQRRRWILMATGLLTVFGAVWGTQVFGDLKDGGFDDPAAEASVAAERIAAATGRTDPDVVVVYRADAGIADPTVTAGIADALAGLPGSEVTAVIDPTQVPGLISGDGRTAYAALTLTGSDESERAQTYQAIADELVVDIAGVETLRGGVAAVTDDITSQVESDLARAEAISFPVLLVLLLVVFGSAVAAGTPLLVGGLAILGAFTALRLMAAVTDVSIFAVNIVTLLGLGLAIDYALFVVSRFREELDRGASVEDAVVRTVTTAGRTVFFSAITVAVSLAALTLFPLMFLRSMGFGGMAAVLVAMVVATTVLPALLGVLGRRVDAFALPWRRSERNADVGEGAWARWARLVMRRPLAFALGAVVLLLVAGAPFLRIQFGGVDQRVLPEQTESRVAAEVLATEFPGAVAEPITAWVAPEADSEQVAQYAGELAELTGVVGVTQQQGSDGSTVLRIDHGTELGSAEGTQLVADLRAVQQPAEVGFTGAAPALADRLDTLGSALPLAVLVAVSATLLLLFLAFGSLVLPVKAVVMNLLSLTAAFGVLVWVFQDGRGADLLNFTPTGFIEASQPILILAIAFGLSMDYEVFLLSRIREEYDRTGDNAEAVAAGLQRTGRIITTAAVLFVVVAGSFATSGIVFITMIGVGLAVAVIMDATVVRVMLVPATMRLLGAANWWLPAPLANWWSRYRWAESEPGAVSEPEAVPAVSARV